jgi:hypothetical protein
MSDAERTADAAQSEPYTPPPLLGCLYCHTEGSTHLQPPRKLLGLGGDLPTLVCSHCHTVALFEAGPPENPQAWRIRYKKLNRAPRYFYMAIQFGTRWHTAEEAMQISRRGYVQRWRVRQAHSGDLSFLQPTRLSPPPPLMSYDEAVYLTFNGVTLKQSSSSSPSATDGTILDVGTFYLTDQKVHLLGHRRDWSHKLSDIQSVAYDEQHWRIYVGGNHQHYQGQNQPDQLDAQLFAAIVEALLPKKAES